MTLSKPVRAALRMKFGGRCAYCGCELPEKGWHADHVENVDREMKYQRDDNGFGKMVLTGKLLKPENDRLDNLYPSCASCNLDKQSMPLESWRLVVAHKVDVCRYDSAFRHAERFGLVVEIKKPVVFWFETYAAVK